MTTSTTPRTAHDRRVLPVVSALEGHGLVDPSRHDEAVAVVDQALGGQVVAATTLRRRLAELAGYVGGALVVAAGALFVADQWMDLSVVQQVGLLAGIAVLLFAAGVTVGVTGGGLATLRAGTQPVRQRLASVLFTAGAVAAAAAVVVWLIDVIEQRGTEMEEGTLIGMGGAFTLIVVAAVGYLLAPTLLGQAAVAVGAGYAIPFTLDTVGDLDPLPLGMTFLALGLVWLALAEKGLWQELLAGRIIGAVFVVVGAQIPVGSDQAWIGYLLTLLVAAAGFAMYVAQHAWPYLAVGVVGVTLAVPEALLDWTEGSLGTAGVLLVAGVTLLGASLVGLRLRKEVEEQSAS
jgi:ribosomal protein L27